MSNLNDLRIEGLPDPIECAQCGAAFYPFNDAAACPSCEEANEELEKWAETYNNMSAWDKYSDHPERELTETTFGGHPMLTWPHILEYKGRKIGKIAMSIGLSKAQALVKWHSDVYLFATTEGSDTVLPHNHANQQSKQMPHISSYKGQPTLFVPSTGKPFSFGLKKAVLFASYIDQIHAFVKRHTTPTQPEAVSAPVVSITDAEVDALVNQWVADSLSFTVDQWVMASQMRLSQSLADMGKIATFADGNRFKARPQMDVPASGNVLVLKMQGEAPEAQSLPLPGFETVDNGAADAAPNTDNESQPMTDKETYRRELIAKAQQHIAAGKPLQYRTYYKVGPIHEVKADGRGYLRYRSGNGWFADAGDQILDQIARQLGMTTVWDYTHPTDDQTAAPDLDLDTLTDAAGTCKVCGKATRYLARGMCETCIEKNPPTTPAAEEAPAIWALTASQYQYRQGVYQPFIGEISTTQYLRFSKRGKTAYENKRSAEWQASADCKLEWRNLVWEAYQAGQFSLDDPAVVEEVKHVVFRRKQDAHELAHKQRTHELSAHLTQDDVELGQRVYSWVWGYGTVAKINAKSIRFQREDGSGQTIPASQCSRYNHRDASEQALKDLGLTFEALHGGPSGSGIYREVKNG